MREPNPRLTLVLPQFSDLVRGLEPVPRLPALETLFARGIRVDGVSFTYEQRLFALFGYETDAELPVGAVRRVGEGAPADDGWWYCAEPVYFLPDRDRVHVIATRELAVRSDEAEALARQFNTHFAADGWRIEVAHPERWYLRAPGPQAVRTVPLARAASRDLRHVLPTGADALRWHSFLNEAQMLFHGSEVNREREQRGLPAINGIWPWGGGTAPALTRRFDQVWSDEPLARGLAALSGSEGQALGERLHPPFAPNTLAVLNAEAAPSWWLAAEERWFVPAKSALAAGALEELVIDGVSAPACRVARRDLRRWWRRRRPVSAYR